MTEEHRKKISEATKKAMANQEIRKKISDAHKGKHLSEEHRKKLREYTPWIKGKRHSEDTKKKMVKAVEKRLSDPTFLKKLKEIHKQRLSNPEEMKRQVDVSRRTLLKLYESGAFPKQTNTKIERDIKDELVKRGYKEGIDFIHQFKFMNKFMCDFCFPDQKVIVEAYGDFWHCNPDKYPLGCKIHPHQIKGLKRDKSKNAYITKVDNHAWTYLVLWENDIKKDVGKCVDEVEKKLKKKIKTNAPNLK